MNLPYPNSAWKMTLQTLHIFLHVPSDGAPLCPTFMFAREWVPLDWECLWWCFAPAPPPPLFNTNLVIKHGKWKIHHLARGFPINCDIHLVWTFSGQPRLITGGFFLSILEHPLLINHGNGAMESPPLTDWSCPIKTTIFDDRKVINFY